MQERIEHIISELNALEEEHYKQTNIPTVTINNSTVALNQSTEQTIGQTYEINEPNSIQRRPNDSFKLNRSKFLNEEQRNQVLQFAFDNKNIIMNQPKTNRIPFF